MKLLLCSAAALSALIGTAKAALPYARLAGMQSTFDAIPAAERDKLVLRQRVAHSDPANHAPIHLWVMADGKRIDLPVAADGSISVPDRPDWVTQNLVVQNDQHPGTLYLQIDLAIAPPAPSAVSVAYLQSAIVQAQKAIKAATRHMAGFLGSLAAPGVHGVTIRLARCCGESLSVGGATIKQAASGTLLVPGAILDASPTATLSTTAPIIAIDPDTD